MNFGAPFVPSTRAKSLVSALSCLALPCAICVTSAQIVSTTDLLVGLADLATGQELRRPEFGDRLAVRGGWHPLLAATTTVPLQPSDLVRSRAGLVMGSPSRDNVFLEPSDLVRFPR